MARLGSGTCNRCAAMVCGIEPSYGYCTRPQLTMVCVGISCMCYKHMDSVSLHIHA